jgi:hypothetical protein
MGRVVVVAVAAALLAGIAPAQAAASGSDYAVMFSDPGDWIGGGSQRVFRTSDSSITMGGSPGYVTVNVSGGTFGDYYSMDFAAPPGAGLAPGYYTRAQRAPFREAGRPGIDISGSGRGLQRDLRAVPGEGHRLYRVDSDAPLDHL